MAIKIIAAGPAAKDAPTAPEAPAAGGTARATLLPTLVTSVIPAYGTIEANAAKESAEPIPAAITVPTTAAAAPTPMAMPVVVSREISCAAGVNKS